MQPQRARQQVSEARSGYLEFFLFPIFLWLLCGAVHFCLVSCGLADVACISSGKCVSHGGGKRCSEEGCGKIAEGGPLCVKHGGGKRCSVVGCEHVQRGKRYVGGLPVFSSRTMHRSLMMETVEL